MTVLYLVPNAYLRQWKRSAVYEENSFLPMTLSGLVAQVLKEGLVSYKEDGILEEVAVWQGVQDNLHNLEFFAPIAHYPGFIQELKWLFRQIDLEEDIFKNLSERGQIELFWLHGAYHRILKKHGILDAPGQMKRALQLTQQRTFLPNVKAIELRGLGELSPLENEFLASLAQERSLEVLWSEVSSPKIEVIKAPDPYTEVEMIGKSIRAQIEQGLHIERIGLAFPNPTQYLPILFSVFEKLRLPWRVPATSLRNTPIGKALLTLIVGELEGWHKHHLKLLTAPGWGFPFSLTGEDHRLLRLGPPLKGLPAWRNYLGESSGWTPVLDFLTSLTQHVVAQPVRDYGIWLEELLGELQPEKWILPEQNLENWAELMKAWDGLQTVAQSLQSYEWVSTPEQFLQLLQALLDNYQIRARRVFAEQLQIVNVEQLGSYTYDQIYIGGLVEGQFPQHKHAHWLTNIKNKVQREQLYQRLISSASHVYLYYPEIDRQGKLNLPATILPVGEKETSVVLSDAIHKPSLFFGQGFLKEQEILFTLQKTVLEKGLSVSQLSRYANCPYQFFCSYVLELIPEEEVSLELDARDRGTILHDVLYKFWNRYLEGPLPSLENAQIEIEGLLLEEYALMGARLPSRLTRSMRDFIRNDLTVVEQSCFRPKYLEKWFQDLFVVTQLGQVEIRGRMDRIDVSPDGEYVLYDYKTGIPPTITAMLSGEDVQMAAYLLAAQTILPQVKNVGVAYYLTKNSRRAGVFHADFHRRLNIRKGNNCLDEEHFIEKIDFFEETMQGIVERILAGEFPITPVSSRICSFCSFQGICRKEVRV